MAFYDEREGLYWHIVMEVSSEILLARRVLSENGVIHE